ncbi:hypothetical protein BBJ28_00024597, partial [Nothophytophthora sp. Chile5]
QEQDRTNMQFEPTSHLSTPEDLYEHSAGSTQTRLRPQYQHIFQHPASASFFVSAPLYFWKQVVLETNTYARVKGIQLPSPVTLSELMLFIGILFYMSLHDKG